MPPFSARITRITSLVLAEYAMIIASQGGHLHHGSCRYLRQVLVKLAKLWYNMRRQEEMPCQRC